MTEKKTKKEESAKFKGKFIKAIGRRKTSVAQVRIYKSGQGAMAVNGLRLNEYFSEDKVSIVTQPLKLTGHVRDIDLSVLVKGGGKKSQSEAIRHGIARALTSFDDGSSETIRAKGWLTRDARKKERKKPGLKKARRAPQWSKR
jgi:small subunit ribosomal protein S9